MIDKALRLNLIKNASSDAILQDSIKKEALTNRAKYILAGAGALGLASAGTAAGFAVGRKKGTTTGQQQVLQRLLPEYIRTRLVVNQLLQERAALNKKIK